MSKVILASVEQIKFSIEFDFIIKLLIYNKAISVFMLLIDFEINWMCITIIYICDANIFISKRNQINFVFTFNDIFFMKIHIRFLLTLIRFFS